MLVHADSGMGGLNLGSECPSNPFTQSSPLSVRSFGLYSLGILLNVYGAHTAWGLFTTFFSLEAWTLLRNLVLACTQTQVAPYVVSCPTISCCGPHARNFRPAILTNSCEAGQMNLRYGVADVQMLDCCYPFGALATPLPFVKRGCASLLMQFDKSCFLWYFSFLNPVDPVSGWLGLVRSRHSVEIFFSTSTPKWIWIQFELHRKILRCRANSHRWELPRFLSGVADKKKIGETSALPEVF